MSTHETEEASTSSRVTSSASTSRFDKGWGNSWEEDDEERGHPDGGRSSVCSEKIRSTSTTTKRTSNEDFGTFPRRGQPVSRDMRDDFFRDDFDERMEQMVREFDARCARSILDDDVRPFGTFPRRGTEDSFFSRPRLLGNNSLFKKSRFRSIFDGDDDDDWSVGRRGHGLDEDSGVFSDATVKPRDYDDVMHLDKALHQDRKYTPEKFQVDVDVKGFSANELLVKTEGNRLVITAKSKEIDDVTPSKISSRELKREFDLPEGVDPYDVVSNLMPDGFLRVEAPVKEGGGSVGRRRSSATETTVRRFSSGSDTQGHKDT
ncbi:uncharacterized protein LOC104266657 isoform X1 [Ciona intestinalis]